VWSGLWLLLAPWTGLWDHNLLARLVPVAGAVMVNPFVRGAVTGVGLVTIAAGVRELFGVFAAPTPPDPPAGAPGTARDVPAS
jgi:hypothetical protein